VRRATSKRRRPPRAALAGIRLLVLDCDGVLTDGSFVCDPEGRRSLAFNIRDGLGLAVLCRAGVVVAIVSGQPTEVAEARHRELGIEHFVGQCRDKGAAVRALQAELGVEPGSCAFVGDDVVDLAGFRACGLAIAVADAAPEVRAAADWVTTAPGGHGAVREVCEALLGARGVWARVVGKLGGDAGPPAP